MLARGEFTEEQKQYLDGFAAGTGLVTRSLTVVPSVPTWQSTLSPATTLPPDKNLTAEENAKRKLNGLDTWDLVLQHARDAKFPKGTDVFLMKFQGLFYVAPAQDAFMCRLRFPGGLVTSTQLRGVADLCEQFGGGYADVTTRANLQIREIGPTSTVDLLMGLHDLGIINRGAGADNIRNVTCPPTAGIDPNELIDTLPLAKQLHHYILNHRDMYGLPRKFNIAFDGGGGSAITALEDTNDIAFNAVRHDDKIQFRLALGGITGHKDFARDTGVMIAPDQCIPVAAAVVRAFIEHGDRTDRKKARLKYVLDRMGFDAFLKEVEKHYAKPLPRVALDRCEPPKSAPHAHQHIGVHPQKQPGLHYIGAVLPVGRMNAAQLRAVADIAQSCGSGSIRLTVWQNLLITDVPADKIDEVKHRLRECGLDYSATTIRGGLVACTGNAGCKFAASNTKLHAMQIAQHVESKLELDHPINIHVTGCPHSCAQHYIGDIGLLATKVPVGEDMVEGYHVYVGGGFGARQGIGREVVRNVIATDAPVVIERMLGAYLQNRASSEQNFLNYVRSLSDTELATRFASCSGTGVSPVSG